MTAPCPAMPRHDQARPDAPGPVPPCPTIVIPAHDEAAVIGRTLAHLRVGLRPGEARIVVVANGCSDDTAAVARAAAPEALVLETARPGKANALNMGALAAPVDATLICLDADLEVTADALRALLAPLADGRALASCGRMDVRMNGASPLVRAFYRGWALNPYFRRGKFGGLFALAPAARARVFPLPMLVADDEYVRRSLIGTACAFVPDCVFVAHPPRTLGALIRVRRRSLRGARAVARMGRPSPEVGSFRAMLARAAGTPALWASFAVFAAVMGVVRLQLALEGSASATRWERDVTSRRNGAAG